VNVSVLSGLDKKRVIGGEFPRAVLSETLPKNVYDELRRSRAGLDTEWFPKSGGNNQRRAVSAYHLLASDLPTCWRAFIQYHVSQEFWSDIWRVFGEAILALYPRLEPTATWQLIPRYAETVGKNDRTVIADCQIGINTPVTTVSRVRGPHIDNPQEVFACMLYMRPVEDCSVGGDLVLYKHRNEEIVFSGKAELSDTDVVEIGAVPYRANQSISWINSLSAIHGVSPRQAGAPCRLFVSICVEYPRRIFHIQRDA